MIQTYGLILIVIGVLMMTSSLMKILKSNDVHQRDDEYDDDEYEDEYYDDEDEDVITEAEVVEIESNEEIQVRELIKELKSKPDKFWPINIVRSDSLNASIFVLKVSISDFKSSIQLYIFFLNY